MPHTWTLMFLLAAQPVGLTKPAGEAVREVLVARCASCHDRKTSTGTPMALKVFDLAEDPWWTRLTDRQLPKMLGRLGGAPAAEKAQVAAFVAGELQRRRVKGGAP
jgi:hypothetical protein